LSKGLGPNLTPCNQYQPMCLFWAGNMETLLNLGPTLRWLDQRLSKWKIP
jgi:hypothetical protein